MSMKINKLEIENVKRVKAVKMEPSASGHRHEQRPCGGAEGKKL